MQIHVFLGSRCVIKNKLNQIQVYKDSLKNKLALHYYTILSYNYAYI